MTENTIGLLQNTKEFFGLGTQGTIIVSGVAITSGMLFLNLYDNLSGITNDYVKCEDEASLKKSLKTRFIVIIILSVVVFVLGLFLSILAKRYETKTRRLLHMLSWTFLLLGVFGILFALINSNKTAKSSVRIGINLVALLFFVIWGVIYFFTAKTE